jgi:hypothetical protein
MTTEMENYEIVVSFFNEISAKRQQIAAQYTKNNTKENRKAFVTINQEHILAADAVQEALEAIEDAGLPHPLVAPSKPKPVFVRFFAAAMIASFSFSLYFLA